MMITGQATVPMTSLCMKIAFEGIKTPKKGVKMKSVTHAVSEHCHMVHQIINNLHQNKDEWSTRFRKKPEN